MSSLVLCGFGCLLGWGILLLILLIKRKGKGCSALVTGFILFTGIYMLENVSLFLQVLGLGVAEVSHKAETVIRGGSFFTLFKEYFLYNDGHSGDYHVGIAVLCLVVGIRFLFRHKYITEEQKKRYRRMGMLLGGILVCCVLSALWGSDLLVSVREKLGSMGTFQLSRLMWLAPLFWYLIFACCLDLLTAYGEGGKWIRLTTSWIFLAVISFLVLKGSHVKPCVQKLINPDYPAISWSDYLAEGVMEQVDAYIFSTTGMEKEEYRVVSLGIDPAAALYHGFYCLDGYSNNYALEYKHLFRRIIAPELEKSAYLTDYFDCWGNRCYLFAAEIAGYYTIEKGSFWYQELMLDTEALKDMGCRYILSAAYIVNSEDMKLKLLEELPFTTGSSYYGIYLYEIL